VEDFDIFCAGADGGFECGVEVFLGLGEFVFGDFDGCEFGVVEFLSVVDEGFVTAGFDVFDDGFYCVDDVVDIGLCAAQNARFGGVIGFVPAVEIDCHYIGLNFFVIDKGNTYNENQSMSNRVVIIDVGSGNLRSAEKAFQRVSYDQDLGFEVVVSRDPEDVLAASHVVLPGQGAFGDCMLGLQAIDGMRDALEDVVVRNARPYLGICVGMQMMVDRGLEHGVHEGLGWIGGEVVPLKIPQNESRLKIPHMGWNDLQDVSSSCSVVLRSTESCQDSAKDFYFVHSFMVECKDSSHIWARTRHGVDFPAIIGRDTMVGVQFHPEKSHDNGLALLGDFLKWNP